MNYKGFMHKSANTGSAESDARRELELLGALILDPSLTNEVIGLVEAEDFIDERAALVYRAMVKVTRCGDKADILSICGMLEGRCGITVSWVSSLMDGVPAALAVEVEQDARSIRRASLIRKLKSLAGALSAKSSDGDVSEVYKAAETLAYPGTARAVIDSRRHELSRNVVGALVRSQEDATDVADVLQPEDIVDPRLRAAYRSILAASASGTPVTAALVASWASSSGQRMSAEYVERLAGRAGGVAAATHAIELGECLARTRLSDVLERAARDCMVMTRPLEEVADAAARAITSATSAGENDPVSAADVIRTCRAKLSCHSPAEKGVTSGINELDQIIGGFVPGDLVIIAGRPGNGKTSAAIGIADHVAQHGSSSGFVTMEMSREQIISRAIFARARVSKREFALGQIDDDAEQRVVDAMESIARAPIYVDEPRTYSASAIRRSVRRLAARSLQAVFVDYLQLISSDDSRANRNEQISSFTRSIKLLARQLGIPLICLSQLRRADARNKNAKPTLDDLRDSGAIEQDADVVIILHRPFLGRPGASESERALTEMIVAKNRDGQTGTARAYFEEKWTRFSNYPSSEPPSHRNYEKE